VTNFEVLRAALFEVAREELYEELAAPSPCMQYIAALRLTLVQIEHCLDMDALATLDWTEALAEKGRDKNRYPEAIPNLRRMR
jgi:hypothetical protein